MEMLSPAGGLGGTSSFPQHAARKGWEVEGRRKGWREGDELAGWARAPPASLQVTLLPQLYLRDKACGGKVLWMLGPLVPRYVKGNCRDG